jgi:hypothetical protein
LSLCDHGRRFSLSPESRDDITRLLHDWSRGDAAALPLRVELTLVNVRVAQTPVDVLDLDAAPQALEAMDPQQVRIVGPSSVKRGWLAGKTDIRRHLNGAIARP